MESEKDTAAQTRQRLEKLKEERLQKENSLKERGEKLSQKALKILKKRNDKSFWEKWGDPIGYTAMGIIVVALIFLNYSGDRRKLKDIAVNEDTFIQSHNENKENRYTLGSNEYFQGKNLQDMTKMLSNEISNKKSFTKCDMTPFKRVEIPKSYNFYESYPQCFIDEEQKKFSTSYAELPISVYKDRACAWENSEDFTPSLNFILNCNKKVNLGNKGGYLFSTLYFMKKGFVSEKCWEENIGAGSDETCPLEKLRPCAQKKIANYCHFEGEENIKKEILQNGPIISVIRPYRDFFIYRSGIYNIKDRSKLEGLVFIKVVGWGESEEGRRYWIVDPLWGKSWGESKTAKIEIGTEDSLIEKYAFTLYPERAAAENSTNEKISDPNSSPQITAKVPSYIEIE